MSFSFQTTIPKLFKSIIQILSLLNPSNKYLFFFEFGKTIERIHNNRKLIRTLFPSILFLIFILIPGISNAQSNPHSNIRKFFITSTASQTIQTKHSIIPSTIRFSIRDSLINLTYKLDNNRLTIDSSFWAIHPNDTLKVFLRVFPINFMADVFIIDANRAKIEDIAIPIEADFDFSSSDRKSLFGKGLKYNGSFSRGISVGNSQNLVLNSQLNLQIDGDLGNGLTISAAISDDQIPIQPEGNTQILQEFDKVFIKIAKKNTSLVAGDYDLKSMPFKFAKYTKKMKGIKLQNTFQKVKGVDINTKASFAVAKGKFVREKLETKEGNQGPYKLRANNSSNYLIVIAGSEKIFLDGKLLKRGEAFDYTIDYNRSEIFFTTKNIIDTDKRVFVEYEYRDQTYLRSMYALQNRIKSKNVIFDIDFFRESDSKSISSNENIDSLDLIILQNAGDDLRKTVRSGISPITNLQDTKTEYYNKIFNAEVNDSILVYTEIADKKSYFAKFSNVGNNKGSYIIDQDANANGRVYKFIGLGQGSYEPIRQIQAPQLKQTLSFGSQIELKNNTKIISQISLSNFDNNRFSNLDNNDNNGIAALIKMDKIIFLDTAKNWKIKTEIASEYIQDYFQSINPYRNVEYNRDWNIKNTTLKTIDLLNQIKLTLSHKQNKLSYGIKSFTKKTVYQGLKQEWNMEIHKEKFGVVFLGSHLSAEEQAQSTQYLRPNADIYYNLSKNWRIGSFYNQEHLMTKDKSTGLLSNNSNDFKKYGFYFETQETKSFTFKVNLQRRLDQKIKQNQLQDAYQADELKLSGKWFANKNARVNIDIAYRGLKIIDSELTNNSDGKNLLGNINLHLSGFKKAIRSNTNYKIGVGQEPKLEFTYEKVQPGEGNYVWKDYNEDKIEQINEFENAIYLDTANYVKIPIFNDEFISTNTIEFTQNLRINPSIYLAKSDKNKWLKKWSSHSSFRYKQKQNITSNNAIIPFFHFNIVDSLVFLHKGSLNNTIFYNKGNPKFDFQVGQILLSNKTTQVSGYELFNTKQYFFRNRINLWNTIDLISKYKYGQKTRLSEKFENRTYDILSHLITATISYRPKSDLRINLTTEYDTRKNQIVDQQNIALSKKLNLNINYKINKKSNLVSDFKYVNVNYNGEVNTPLHTVMLDGLNKGNNYIWSLLYTRSLWKYTYLTLRYNGRKTGDVSTLHTANIQLKASF